MEKRFVRQTTISLPPSADDTHELVGEDKRERFLLDLWRGTLRLSKLKFQTRVRKIIVLARLDINGSAHTNPDGAKMGGTHLHLYREGFEDKWAYPLDLREFPDTTNILQTLQDFCRRCRIVNIPPFQGGLYDAK
jgi:hypothetical protein